MAFTPEQRAAQQDYTSLHHGFIAQEVESVLGLESGIVKYEKEIDKYYLKYGDLIAPLVKAVQELTKRVQELETKSL